MSKDIKVVKKISLKIVVGLDREADMKAHMIAKAPSQPDIAAFAGDIVGYRTVVGQFGKSFALIGTFVAQNIETGECFEGGQLFLPKDASDSLVAQFDGRKQDDQFVNFSCVVKVVPDKAQGFMYITTPIKTAQSVTRKAELLANFASIPKSLPAPGPKKAA